MKSMPSRTNLLIQTIDDLQLLPKGFYACYFMGTAKAWGDFAKQNPDLKQKLWDLSDSGQAILVQEPLHGEVNAYLVLKTLQQLKPSLNRGIIKHYAQSPHKLQIVGA
jgi:hypothetical protein